MDHLIIVKHENDLIKHLMEPREREVRGTLSRRHLNNITKNEKVLNLSLIIYTPLHTVANRYLYVAII